MTSTGKRKLRKDAAENAERLIAAAARAGLAEGKFVPLERTTPWRGVSADAADAASRYREYRTNSTPSPSTRTSPDARSHPLPEADLTRVGHAVRRSRTPPKIP